MSAKYDRSFEETTVVYEVQIGLWDGDPKKAGVRRWSGTHNFTHLHIHKHIEDAVAECEKLRRGAATMTYKGIKQKPVYRIRQTEKSLYIINY